MFQRWLLSLKHTNQPLLALNFSSAASSPLTAFTCLKRVRALLQIRLWFKGMLWLVWSSTYNIKTFSISAKRLFRFLICVFTGRVLFTSFKNFSFAFTTWLTVWLKRPSFRPTSALSMSCSWNLIISSFWFKVSNIWLFLSLEHFQGHSSVSNRSSFNIAVSQWLGRPEERKKIGKRLIYGAVKTHATSINWVCHLIWVEFIAPEYNYNSNINSS